MNQERSRSQERTSSQEKDQPRLIFPSEDKNPNWSASQTDIAENLQDSHNSLIMDKLQFYWQHSGQNYFKCGLVWGTVFGFTAILSASCGVALAQIDVVEKAITQTINRHSSIIPKTARSSTLDRPVNILLLEVQPDRHEMLKFSQSLQGETTTILLLKFQPHLGLAEVINIPVNSRVKIPGLGWGTIADAHRYGNTPLVSQMVRQLLDGVTIDRYLRATPATFGKLITSGKITLNFCDANLEDCTNPSQKLWRQKIAVETIRQRLNIPTYGKSFASTLIKVKPELDTNLSVPETMAVANYVKELATEQIEVKLVPDYTPGQAIASLSNQSRHSPRFAFNNKLKQTAASEIPGQNITIAVQNTTNSPELALRLIAYLRQQNFRDVYLVEQIPLRLKKTKIITHQSQMATAAYLKQVIGLGRLDSRIESAAEKPLTIQIGEDARHLDLNRDLDFSRQFKHNSKSR